MLNDIPFHMVHVVIKQNTQLMSGYTMHHNIKIFDQLKQVPK